MIEVVDVADRRRFEVRVDGETAGFAEYEDLPGRRSFVHTVIDDRFEGQGLASTLVRAALDRARRDAVHVRPVCVFVRGFIAKHPEYADLVAPDERERFGVA